jgi:hypothetical protein
MADKTDKAKLIELLEGFGVVHTVREEGKVVHIVVDSTSTTAEHGKLRGYSDFFVDFRFNSDGRFDYMGIWE